MMNWEEFKFFNKRVFLYYVMGVYMVILTENERELIFVKIFYICCSTYLFIKVTFDFFFLKIYLGIKFSNVRY